MLHSTLYIEGASMSITRLGFYLCILGLVAAATSCRANGQNCQVHWDCCSRKCMTYLSVCAKKIARVFSLAVLPQSNSTQKNDAKQSAHQFPDKKSVRTPQEE